MILRWLRYALGYVVFEGEGVYGERFFNLLFFKEASLWDIQKKGIALQGRIRASHYKRVRDAARTSGVRVRIAKKCGAPFLLRRLLKRKGVLAGVALFAVVMAVLTSFVWSVEVAGNENIGTDALLQAVYEEGIKPSALIAGIDFRKAEQEILLKMPELAWAGFITSGSRVILNVRERVMPPDMVKEGEPCNIIAAREGVLVNVEPYDGQAVKKEGEAVLEGELIISGAFEDKKGTVYLKHARGKVIANTVHTLTESVTDPMIERTQIGGIEIRRSLSLLGITVPLHLRGAPGGIFDVSETATQLSLLGLKLPMLLTVTEVTYYKETEVSLTEEGAMTLLQERIAGKEAAELEGAEVKKKEEHFAKTQAGYELTVRYSCTESIGKEQAIEIGS